MFIKKVFILLILIVCCSHIEGQVTGGVSSFDFIQQSANPRVLGLGGENISLRDEDQNLVLNNPALLNEEMHNHASINIVPYFSDIWFTSLNYAFQYKETGMWNIGFQYFNYGQFDSYDESETFLGTFSAKDYAFILSKSHTQNQFSIGASLKYVGSSIGSYNASAVLFDIGGVFSHPEKDFNIGLTIKNAGFVLSDFTTSTDSELPFDAQLGLSFKPQYMPIRLSFTAHHLNEFDIAFFDPEQNLKLDDSGNEVTDDEPGFADKLIRHFVIGTELIVSDNFQLRAGYNALRRKELKLKDKGGMSGFSFGAMIKLKAFEFAFTRAIYHAAGGISSLGLTMDFNKVMKRKESTKIKKTKEQRDAERQKALKEYRERHDK